MIALVYTTYLFFIMYAALQFYWAVSWLTLKKVQSLPGDLHHWSIIIPFRNEAANVTQLLSSLCGQFFPPAHYEMILVNDHSNDEGAALLKQLLSTYPDHMISVIDNVGKGKKAAITTGVRAAIHEHIITTDADVTHSSGWLRAVDRYFTDKNLQVLCGPVLQLAGQEKPFHYFQALDYLGLTGISIVAGNKDLFYNASGANIAFKKEFYLNASSQRTDKSIASGDDFFLVQQARRAEIKFPKDKELIVYTHTEANWQALLSQRQRWGAKSFSYRSVWIPIIWSIPVVCSYLLIILALMALLTFQKIWLGLFLFGFTVKFMADFAMLKVMHDYFRAPRFRYFILSELMHIWYLCQLSWRILTFRKMEWKGRTIRK